MKLLMKRSSQGTTIPGHGRQPIKLRSDPPKESTQGLGWFVLVVMAAIVSLFMLFHHQSRVQPTNAQLAEFHQEQTRRLIEQDLVRQYAFPQDGGIAYGVERKQ